MITKVENKKKLDILLGYSFIHGIIDFCCAFVVLNSLLISKYNSFHDINLIILYNVLAFALQFPFGILIDRYKCLKESALIGCLLVLTSFLFLSNPFLVILLAGLGNAFFHIGGGGLSLNIETNKAFFPGIFVAPGALGLTLGILLGNSGYLTYWPFILLLLISIVFIIIKKIPSINYQKVSIKREVNYFNFILLGLFFSICIRSLYGVTAVFDWKSNIILLVISTVFVVIGKFLGGFLADKYGWIKITTIVLLISAPILSFYKEIPFLAILGGCFFQMTMPMTLVGVSNLLPGRPATSFGLTTFALILGAMPLYLGWKNLFYGSFISLLLISISAVLLLFSFKLGFNYLKKKQKINL